MISVYTQISSFLLIICASPTPTDLIDSSTEISQACAPHVYSRRVLPGGEDNLPAEQSKKPKCRIEADTPGLQFHHREPCCVSAPVCIHPQFFSEAPGNVSCDYTPSSTKSVRGFWSSNYRVLVCPGPNQDKSHLGRLS